MCCAIWHHKVEISQVKLSIVHCIELFRLAGMASLVPRLLPRKTERSMEGIWSHAPWHTICGFIYIFELLPCSLGCRYDYKSALEKLFHYYLTRFKILVWYFKCSFYCSSSPCQRSEHWLSITVSARILWKTFVNNCEFYILHSFCHSERKPALWMLTVFSTIWSERGIR